jgi:hypothetical protein
MLGLLVEAFEWISKSTTSKSFYEDVATRAKAAGLRYATLAKCQRRRVLKTEAYTFQAALLSVASAHSRRIIVLDATSP